MAVFGVGGVGLNVIQGGAMVAAHPIIAVDVAGAKLEHARAARAPPTWSTPHARTRRPPSARITRRGADYTFVAVGDTRAMTQAVDALAPGGTCVLIGVPETGATVPLDVRPLVTGERVIRGSSYGSARTREDLPRLVSLYLAGKLRIDELITRRYALEEANEAFRALAAGELGPRPDRVLAVRELVFALEFRGRGRAGARLHHEAPGPHHRAEPDAGARSWSADGVTARGRARRRASRGAGVAGRARRRTAPSWRTGRSRTGRGLGDLRHGGPRTRGAGAGRPR